MLDAVISFGSGQFRPVARTAIVGAMAVLAALLLFCPETRKAANPMHVGSAYASAGGGGSVCAAPNYLALTASGSGKDKFYIIDTNKKIICLYQVQISEIRLVSARKFDEDERIWDASAPLYKNKPLEGGEGFTRSDAKDYADSLEKTLDAGKTRP